MNYLLRKKVLVVSFILSFCAFKSASSQIVANETTLRINTVTTAVPFLRIIPDARAGGMGDVGIASPSYGNPFYQNPDANSIYLNPAKLAFVDKDYGFAVTFSPWLKSLVNDIYLANINGYFKVKEMQTISMSLRYFSLGNITFTDNNGSETGQFRPNEFAIDAHYARKLGKYFSIAASLRYIYSNLAGGQSLDGNLIRAGHAGAGDISWFFHKRFKENEANKLVHDFSVGMNISNIGSKISYTSNFVRDYIPTNLGIGFGYTLDLDKHNSFGLYVDINKLMVPTPIDQFIDSSGVPIPNPKWSTDGDAFPDFRQKSSIAGMFTSFGDAPGGFSEEMREFTIGVGAEYLYNRQFGVRLGYFYEPRTKGGRQFLTAGLMVKYSVVGLNFSYLIPTTIQRNPLDNTLRFSLLFDFSKGGKKAGTGVSLIEDSPKEKKSKKGSDAPQQKELQPLDKPQQ